MFRRVSGFDWDDLIGAPHRLIRHPDMPKAVFRLLWDRIARGLPTGAYVKNRTRDGGYYWVFAVVTPVEGGLLSVRIKPSSPIFRRAQAIYDVALTREAEGCEVADSAAALIEDLRAAGFPSYDEFMGVALFNEVRARCDALARKPPPRLTLIAEMHSLLREALREKLLLLRAFEDIRSIPTNLHIVASRLEVYGGPVSTIAENYRMMSADVIRRLEDMAGAESDGASGDKMQARVSEGLFLAGATLILAEAAAGCGADQCAGNEAAVEGALLGGLERDYQRQTVIGLGAVSRAAVRLGASCEDLKRLMLGLDSIRVLCRVEAGRMTRGGEGLQAIITTLDRFHGEVAVKLDKILDLSNRIVSVTESALKAGR